jgi:hypothetical protein
MLKEFLQEISCIHLDVVCARNVVLQNIIIFVICYIKKSKFGAKKTLHGIFFYLVYTRHKKLIFREA